MNQSLTRVRSSRYFQCTSRPSFWLQLPSHIWCNITETGATVTDQLPQASELWP